MKQGFLLCLAVSIFGCASRKFYASPLPANPTAYIFPVGIENIGNTFNNLLSRNGSYYGIRLDFIYFQGDGYSKSHWDDMIKEYPGLSGDENKHDIWINLTVDSSTVYHGKNGRKLECIMECKIHCTSIDLTHTRMEVQVYSSKVKVGESLLPVPPHFGHSYIMREVKPTAVEAYKILLCIGKGLGIDKQMPALKTN